MTKGLWVKTGASTWSQVSENNSSNFALNIEEDIWPKAEIVYVKTGATTWTQAWNRIPPTPAITKSVEDERQITITWESGDFDEVPFDFVKWQFTKNNGSTWIEDDTNKFLRQKTITGLNEGTSYYIGVRMVDTAGKTAQAIQLLTTDNVPPEAPYNLTVDSRTQTSLSVSWDFDVIPGDFLRWRFSSNGGSTWVNSTNSSLRSYTFTGLTAGDFYNLVVRIEDTGGNTADDTTSSYTLPPTPAAPTLTKGNDGWTSTDYAVLQSDIDAGTDTLASVTRSISCSLSYNGKANNQYCYFELLDSADGSLETSDNFDLVTSATTLTYEFTALSYNTTYKVRLVSVDNEGEEISGTTASVTTDNYNSVAITDVRQAYEDNWLEFGYADTITSSGNFSSIYVAENVGDNNASTAWVSTGFSSAGSSGSSVLPYIEGQGTGGQSGESSTTHYTEIGQIRIRSGYAQSYSLHIGIANASGVVTWQGTGTIQGYKYVATSTYNDTGNYDTFNFTNVKQHSGRTYYVRLYIWGMDRWPNATTSSYRAIIRDIQILEREWAPENYQSDTAYY
jgi:hypothetical protein